MTSTDSNKKLTPETQCIRECRPLNISLEKPNEESTRLSDTGLVVELELLKTKTRLIDEKFVSVKGECET